ncbi:MAG: hypothetical protein E6R03_02310 [Hyphomicrobiaceae bacterium]|nr:MAG: hypothetical protein E6R03_02310 [Hyphomicrobiaceae bacterium]
MANRLFTQFSYSFFKKRVTLHGEAAIGSSGAPTIATSSSKGITSIARNSTGKYTITTADKYRRLLTAMPTIIKSSGDPGPTKWVVRTDGLTSTPPTVVIEFLNDAGTATEIASGSTLRFKLEMADSVID